MMRIATGLGAVLGGWGGWTLGQTAGVGVAFGLGALGSILGVIGGWWLVRRHLG